MSKFIEMLLKELPDIEKELQAEVHRRCKDCGIRLKVRGRELDIDLQEYDPEDNMIVLEVF
jgi:hypothetical protein